MNIIIVLVQVCVLLLMTIVICYALAFPEPLKGSRTPTKNRKPNPLDMLTAVKKENPTPVRKASKGRPAGGPSSGQRRGAKQLHFYDEDTNFDDEDQFEAEGGPEYEDLDAEETGHAGRFKRSLLGRLFGYPSGHYRRTWWPANHRRHHLDHHHERHHHRWGNAY